MAYSALTFTASEVPTLTKWNQLWANDAAMNDGSGIGNGVIGSRQLAVGVPVQAGSFITGSVSTGTTVIPGDDTIPQSNEGDQYMSYSFTPKASTNRLAISVSINLSSSNAASDFIASLLKDSDTNSLAAGWLTQGGTTYKQTVRIEHDMVAGTTSPITFKVRAGNVQAGTTTFNGQSTARLLGGVMYSCIKIIEYKA